MHGSYLVGLPLQVALIITTYNRPDALNLVLESVALQSRLAENTFMQEGLVDMSGPIIRLQNLSPEDLYVLLLKLRSVFAGGDDERHLVPDAAIEAFMQHCSQRIGDAYFRTPRNSVKAFIDLLSILDQNPDVDWQDLITDITIDAEAGEAVDEEGASSDDLTSFKL